MRLLEDALPVAAWTDTVHVTLSELKGAAPEAHIDAKVAIDTLHNNNGIGHGPSLNGKGEEILVTSAASGKFHLATVDEAAFPNLVKHKTISFDKTLDNPYYFSDSHASEADNLSGYVLAGMTKAHRLEKSRHDPDLKLAGSVHFVPRSAGGKLGESRIIFEDNGDRINMITTAIMTPINPKDGKKQAWLWATGLVSKSVIAVRVDLS